MITRLSDAADPYKGIADLLPRLAINIGWLKMMGEARVEQTGRQRRMQRTAPVSPQQAAHLARKRAARAHRAKRRIRDYRGLAFALPSPRPIGRGAVVSPTR